MEAGDCEGRLPPPFLVGHEQQGEAQVSCWDRGRPARNERGARKWVVDKVCKNCAPKARCKRDACGPSSSLE
jgi:hypothetical protein